MDECDTTECLVVAGVCAGLFILLIVWFAWRYPIRNKSGVGQKALSVFLAILFFPAYALIFAFQNPLQTNGVDQPILTLVVVLVFWPTIFFIPVLNGTADGTAKVRDSTDGEWV